MAIESQPAIRLLGLKGVATPPAPKATPSGAAGAHTSVLPASGVDRFGNAIGCQDKTVPIGRTTLEQMTRFQTLQAFLRRPPAGKGKLLAAKDSSNAPLVAEDGGYLQTYSLGASTTLSINDPQVNTSLGEVLSESGVEIEGAAPANSDVGIEQVEAMWSVYPGYFGDEQSHLEAALVRTTSRRPAAMTISAAPLCNTTAASS